MNTLLNKYINMFEQDNRHTDSLDFARIKKTKTYRNKEEKHILPLLPLLLLPSPQISTASADYRR